MTRRELALHVWGRLLFEPYRWAGDDPLQGYDCSGLVIEGLRAAGVLPREGDWTADELSKRFHVAPPQPGCLLFWLRGGVIGHVEIVWAVIGGTPFTIGASGGGSQTISLPAAIAENAYVKIRPALPGWHLCLDPFL